MQNLINSPIENFSNQHIFNLGQYDSFSRLDSFGDIPGHEIILFLDLRILWARSPSSFCSSEWVLLVIIRSYMDFSGQRCKWVQNKLLSMTFLDSLIPSVLGTLKVVTVGYNFPTGEHQFDTLIKNFVIQVEKTKKWLSDCFRPCSRSFQLEVFGLCCTPSRCKRWFSIFFFASFSSLFQNINAVCRFPINVISQ